MSPLSCTVIPGAFKTLAPMSSCKRTIASSSATRHLRSDVKGTLLYTSPADLLTRSAVSVYILSFRVVTRRWSSWQSDEGSSRPDREYGEDMYVLEWVTTNLFILEDSGHFQASRVQYPGLWAAEPAELHPRYAVQWVEPWSSFVCENWNHQL